MLRDWRSLYSNQEYMELRPMDMNWNAHQMEVIRLLATSSYKKNWLIYFVTPKSSILIGFSVISHPAIGVTHLWKLLFGSLNSTPMPRLPPLRLHVKTILGDAAEVIVWLAWETLQKSLQVNFLHPKLCYGNPLLL